MTVLENLCRKYDSQIRITYVDHEGPVELVVRIPVEMLREYAIDQGHKINPLKFWKDTGLREFLQERERSSKERNRELVDSLDYMGDVTAYFTRNKMRPGYVDINLEEDSVLVEG